LFAAVGGDGTMSSDLIAKLVAIWPKAFFINQADRRPLKLGIHRDMAGQACGLTSTELRRAVSQYCQSPGYLAACTEGAPRIGVNGEVAGTVSAEAVQKMHCAQQAKAEKVAAVTPERQMRKVSTQAAPSAEAAAIRDKNANGAKLSLADLRVAAKARQATGA
jgi:ProP effector